MTEEGREREAGGMADSHAPARALQTQPLAGSHQSAPLFAEYLRQGAKSRAGWRCGLEFELFGYDAKRERLDAAAVQAVLADLAASPGDCVYEAGTLVEAHVSDEGRVTIEPGGQIEFSGAPHMSLAVVERGLREFLTRLRASAEVRRFVFLGVGYDPLRTPAEQRWFPKPRYQVMRPYLAARGARAWDMMSRTCAAQVNLDYGAGIEDLAKKFIVGNRLAPVVTAMFANSPFEDGRPSGYKSTRAAAWLQTDDARSGIAAPALRDDFSVEGFVNYALDVPMIFARRNSRYLDAPAGLTFRQFLDDGAPEGLVPVFEDWTDHLSTIFTDARLKQYVELRSADANGPALTLALAALWKGLFYDAEALNEASRLAPALSANDARALREAVAREALSACAAGVNVLNLARDLLALAAEGLTRVAADEVVYLDPLRQLVGEDRMCPADVLLRDWHGAWHGSMARVFDRLRVA